MDERGVLSVTQGLEALALGGASDGLNLASLPKDVLTSIFRHGDFAFLRTVVLVCRRFVQVVKQDHVLRKRIALLVFEDTKTPFAEHDEKKHQSVFALVDVPTKDWPGRKLEVHARFYCTKSRKEGRLPSYVNIAVVMEGQSSASDQSLAYFSDGDNWIGGDRSDYPGGFGLGSAPARFLQGHVVSMLVDLDVASYADKKTVQPDLKPTCAVTFFKEGVMVHLPFLIAIDLTKLRLGVNLPSGCRAEIVAKI